MKRQGRLSRRLAVGALVGALVLGISTWTLAAIPETGTGIITGCYNEIGGSLRVIDGEAGAECRPNERQITWNHTGPRGLPGKDGIDGTNGLNGADGKTVLNGTGAPANTIGTDGDFYLDTAAVVLYGPKSGGSWPAPGVSLIGPEGQPGKKGDNGADGKTVLNGTGAPANTIGTDGDFYLDTSAAVLYGPKAGKSWPAAGLSLVGRQGPQGPAGPPGVGLNPLHIATLRWYEAATGIGVDLGAQPSALTFDGAHVWVATGAGETHRIKKVHAADGALVSSFPVEDLPRALAFDGVNIWAISSVNTTKDAATLTRRAASDGSGLRQFSALLDPTDIAFDGSSVWVAGRVPRSDDFAVMKLRATDGATQGTFTIPGPPSALAFDGANVWVATAGQTTGSSGNVTKLRASDGVNLGTFTVGVNPSASAFDGASVWVANFGSDTVTKLRASDGTPLGTFPVGDGPKDLVFDGVHVWVAHEIVTATTGSVTKLRVSDGFAVATFQIQEKREPSHLVFDGANVWASAVGSHVLWKL